MALTGTNGDNVTNIGLSKSISFSIYDEFNKEIEVSNQKNPIDFWISKDTSGVNKQFMLVNALNATTINASSPSFSQDGSVLINGFMVSGFNLSGSNVSMHIQLKPQNKSLSYLTLIKLGDNPALSNSYYDMLHVFCPTDLTNEDNDSYYLMFANMSFVNAHKGYVGFSVAEISTSNLNCFNKSLNTVDKLLELTQNQTNTNQSTFSDNYWIRIYSSGCYYMNKSTNEWSSYGMEILSDTNFTHTHCTSNHLTSFAGGFIVLPPAINFNQVWANASFLKNPVIYSTVIALVSLYILLAIWSRYMDSKDSKKVGITLLGDLKDKENKYVYEIIVFTGTRMNAGTDSKVCLAITFMHLK